MTNYRELYQILYKKIDVEKVFKTYNIRFKTCFGNKGKEFTCRCPFPEHDDLTPSFSFNQKSGIWNCFVCGGGDFFKFIKIMEDLSSIKEAINFVKRQVGYNDDFQVSFQTVEKNIKSLCENKKEEDQIQIPEIKEVKLPNCVSAEKYFDIVKKRVDIETIRKWQIMYCAEPKNKFEDKYKDRLIIPVYFKNMLVTFAARDMSDKTEKWNKIKKEIKQGKYSKSESEKLIEKYEYKKILYPFGAPLSYIFFNWDEAIKQRKYVILVEGILDAIKLIEYGFNTISILSCHLNDYRINMLLEHFDSIYVCLDNDPLVMTSSGELRNPGQDAAFKLIKKISDVKAFNIVLPIGKDPDECTKDEFEMFFNKSQNFF